MCSGAKALNDPVHVKPRRGCWGVAEVTDFMTIDFKLQMKVRKKCFM